jgi:microsomal dipeptidase-like Zn-dependent dipeptidase
VGVLAGQVAGTGLASGGGAGHDSLRRVEPPSRFALANHCWALTSVANGRFIATRGDGYRLGSRSKSKAADLYMKPTRLGAYLVYDQDGELMTAAGRRSIERGGAPGEPAEWRVRRAPRRSFQIVSSHNHRKLAISRSTDQPTLAGAGNSSRRTRFEFKRDGGCRVYPEAKAGATGRPFKGTRADGTVRGFVDAHLHITADMRAGGRVIDGRSFARFGITRALGGDARNHGPDGSLDVTGNLLRSGTPFGTHDTHGWPTFAGWPVHDTITHQQTYYVWLKRVWKAGERLVVAQTVEDQPLCRLEPRRSHSCSETQTIKLEIKRLKRLQDYVDAQSGGPGRGWFRIVRNPGQARRVIERGKLAVVLGIESSDLFDCGEFMGESDCTRADVDRGIRDYKRLGVRSMFIAHWVDNAFSGAALEGGSRGAFINILQVLQTGEYFHTSECPEPGQGEEVQPLSEGILKFLSQFFPAADRVLDIPIPDYPAGPQCNAKGLTELGRYLVRRMMANHMLIEVDHMSERARLTVLDMAEKRDYPLVSSHTDTGGFWTASDLRRLYGLGGFATATESEAPELADRILSFRPYRNGDHYFGVGLGTDTGGFSDLPGPREDAAADPLAYPFRSYEGDVRFTRERTGQRTFDLNTDGVAHYGLIADLLADMQHQPGGQKALPLLFRSAEAYLDTWRAAVRHG